MTYRELKNLLPQNDEVRMEHVLSHETPAYATCYYCICGFVSNTYGGSSLGDLSKIPQWLRVEVLFSGSNK